MAQYHLSVDIETFSSVTIGDAGLYKYAQSPDFEILLFGYAWGDGEPGILDLASDSAYWSELDTLRMALQDPDVIKHAYNAPFEWYCLNRAGFVTPLEQWHCTMHHGLYCGYTSGLAATGEAIGLPEDKRKATTGRALIKYFCTPRIPTAKDTRTRNLPHHDPDRWQLFKDYCMQDVVTEREIECRLTPWPVPEEERRLWLLDQRINAGGVAVDLTMVDGALHCDAVATERLTNEAILLSGLDNPNSMAQLKTWLTKQTGEEVTSLRKDDVPTMIQSADSGAVKRVLEIRQELGKTSTSKYAAMRAAACDDGRVRGLLQFYGANRTGRWAGRLVQVQNLPRNYLDTLDFAREMVSGRRVDVLQWVYGNVPDTLSQLIRTAFIPSPGRRLIVADFSAIEARVVAWLAGEAWRQEVFATHGKIYEASASAMFGVPIEEIAKGKPGYELRQKGKIAELALGYGGSTGALISMGALKMGLNEEELPDIVQRWRAANKRIVGLWSMVERAALDTVSTGRPNAARGAWFAREIDAAHAQDFLTVQLPAGRKLFYVQPRILLNKFGRDALHYLGVNQQTRKWETTSTFGGKLVENLVQAISRDCLAVALLRLAEVGYETVFHVHDEVVIDARPDQSLEAVLDIMKQPIPWAEGLQLNADGYETDYYKKE